MLVQPVRYASNRNQLQQFFADVRERSAGCGPAKGEASYLIDRCRDYEVDYASLATTTETRRLKREGLWRERLTEYEATSLLGTPYLRDRVVA